MSADPVPDPEDVYFAPEDTATIEEEQDAIEVMWMERNAQPFRPTPEKPFRAVRCTGITKNGPRTGKRCGRKATLGTTICEAHGANLPSVKKAAANRVSAIQLRLVGMTDDAVDGLEDLMANGQSEAVRLKAYTEVLDRAGVRGGADINVTVETVDSAAAAVRERLETLKKRTIEGEVLAAKVLNDENLVIEHVTVDPVDEHHPAEENQDG